MCLYLRNWVGFHVFLSEKEIQISLPNFEADFEDFD